MRESKSKTFDVSILNSRITVTDSELAFMLGVGLPTAREISKKAEAALKIGGRKLNNVSKIKKYIDEISN